MNESFNASKRESSDHLNSKIGSLLDDMELIYDKLVNILETLTKVKRLENILKDLREEQINVNKKVIANSGIISNLEESNTITIYGSELNRNREKYLNYRRIKNAINNISQNIESSLYTNGLECCDVHYIISLYKYIALKLVCTDLSNKNEIKKTLETIEELFS